MRIHTNSLTVSDVYTAAWAAGISVERAEVKGSRSRDHALDVIFSGSGTTGGAWGNSGTNGAAPYKSATWDEWGIALAVLFSRDDSVTIPGVYEDAEHFAWLTGNRFSELIPAQAHRRHRWEFQGSAVNRGYTVRTCTCGAIERRLPFRTSWSEFTVGA